MQHKRITADTENVCYADRRTGLPFFRNKSKALVHVKNFRTCIRTVSSFLHEEINILEFYFSWTFKNSEVYEKIKKK